MNNWEPTPILHLFVSRTGDITEVLELAHAMLGEDKLWESNVGLLKSLQSNIVYGYWNPDSMSQEHINVTIECLEDHMSNVVDKDWLRSVPIRKVPVPDNVAYGKYRGPNSISKVFLAF